MSTSTNVPTTTEPNSPQLRPITDFGHLTPSDVEHDHTPEGFDLIREIETDPRFCTNCYKLKKDIETPPESSDINDCVKGFTWPEDHTTMEWFPRQTADGKEGTLKPTLVCSCGVANGSIRLRPLTTHDAIEAAESLSDAANLLLGEHMASALEAHQKAYGDADDDADFIEIHQHLRIAGALTHDPDALVTAIEKFKRTPEITKTNMRGDWSEHTPIYPDELFRRAFSLASRRSYDK